MTTEDDDAGAAFDRAAARAAKRERAAEEAPSWVARHNERRFRAAVGRLVLVLFLLPAHVVAARHVTVWLVLHLVLVAVMARQVVTRWLARGDARWPGT